MAACQDPVFAIKYVGSVDKHPLPDRVFEIMKAAGKHRKMLNFEKAWLKKNLPSPAFLIANPGFACRHGLFPKKVKNPIDAAIRYGQDHPAVIEKNEQEFLDLWNSLSFGEKIGFPEFLARFGP